MSNLIQAATDIQNFVRDSLTERISDIESALKNKNKGEIVQYLENETINSQIIQSAFSFKAIISQIYVIIHSIGILLTLPEILSEDELVISLSLGAGNTGRDFDLETTERVAEFKFINWRGGSEAIRQNSLFKDFYLLAESPLNKKKELYVINKEIPIQFLRGGRAIDSVFSRNNKLLTEFRTKYGTQFTIVKEYYSYRQGEVEILDLKNIIPEYLELSDTNLTDDTL